MQDPDPAGTARIAAFFDAEAAVWDKVYSNPNAVMQRAQAVL